MVSIIIPHVNYKEGIKRLMISIIDSTEREITIIIEKNDYKGFAVTVNKALRKALVDEKEGIIILNDDIRVFPGWLEQLQRAAQDGTVGIVADRWMTFNKDSHVPFYFVYVKREVFDRIGLLDERYIGGECEDIDFCVRAIDAGYKIVETENVNCVHKVSQTLKTFNPALQEERKKNKQRFLDKWKNTKWYEKFVGRL